MPVRKLFKSISNSKPVIAIAVFSVFALAVLTNPKETAQGAANGLVMCAQTVIPSLFTFTVLSVFLTKSGVLCSAGSKIDRFTKRVFKISGDEIIAAVLSLMGGYPIGAAVLNGLYSQGRLSKNAAEKRLIFCINASPAFYIIVVGRNIFKNNSIGLILFFSNLISCIILNLLIKSESTRSKSRLKNTDICLSDAFVASVNDGCLIMLGICGWIVLFSSVFEYLKSFIGNEYILCGISGILEVTIGVFENAGIHMPISVFALLLGLGGLSSVFQVCFAAEKIKPSVLKLITGRIIHALLSFLITKAAVAVFKPSVKTFAASLSASNNSYYVYLPSIMLIITGAAFLYFTAQKNTKCEK